MWLWTTAASRSITVPDHSRSLGWTQTIDIGLARTLFAWTLHPIVYFWLLPAYIAFYTMARGTRAGGSTAT